VARRRQVVEAFLAAAREGDFGALLTVLDPDVVLRADAVAVSLAAANSGRGAPELAPQVAGADAVARVFAGRARAAAPALLDGDPGLAFAIGGRTVSLFRMTIVGGRVTAVDHASLTAHPGTVTGITGPSGSGKSSLLAVAATPWAWADRLAADLDTGFSAGMFAALAMTAVTLHAPWRLRLRVVLVGVAVVGLLFHGELADLEHALALVLALSVGFLNGYLVMKTKIPSFLITLSSFFMIAGVNLAVTKLVSGQVATQSVNDMQGWDSAHLIFASSIPLFGVEIRVTVVWWLVFTAIATYVLFKTKIGNWIFAVGGDADSARAVGVPVTKVKIGLFMFVGFCAWFVGMHLLFAFNTVQSGQGIGNEFFYIIAAVVGGCLLTGGYGTAIGAAIGAFIFGMANQGIVYAGWDPDWFKFFLGAMLLFAVIANNAFRNYAAKR